MPKQSEKWGSPSPRSEETSGLAEEGSSGPRHSRVEPEKQEEKRAYLLAQLWGITILKLDLSPLVWNVVSVKFQNIGIIGEIASRNNFIH